jgi:uncharacterized protein (TIGR02996 family)
MTPREAFVQAIRDAPDDDTLRLVFADWLEENGEAARAEFIRVQIALARPSLNDEFGQGPLRDRENELMEALIPEWLSALGIDAAQCGGSRGFIEELSLGVGEFLRRGEHLLRAEPIRVLRVRPAQPEVASLRELLASPAIHQLSELDLSGHCQSLEWPGVRAAAAVGDYGLGPLLESRPPTRLEVLRLARNDIGILGAEILAASEWLARLSTLDLAGNLLGPEGCRLLIASPHVGRLEILDLCGAQEYNSETGMVRTVPNIGEAGVIHLAREVPAGLRCLKVAFNRVERRGVAALVGSAGLARLALLNVYEEFDGRSYLGPRAALEDGWVRRLRDRFGERVVLLPPTSLY